MIKKIEYLNKECLICGKAISGNARKYCPECSFVKQKYDWIKNHERKKRFWASLSEKEKLERMEKIAKFYLYKEENNSDNEI